MRYLPLLLTLIVPLCQPPQTAPPAETSPPVIRFVEFPNEKQPFAHSIITLRPDPGSLRNIRGFDCYTKWRSERVYTNPWSKYVTVWYFEDGKPSRFGAPAHYRFEFDGDPKLEKRLYWQGDELYHEYRYADAEDMYALVRELGVDL